MFLNIGNMKKFIVICSLILSTGCVKEWSYNGKYNSEKWGDVSKDFKFCKIGFNQSPIDVNKDLIKDFQHHELEFNYHDSIVEKSNQKYHQKLVVYGDSYLFRGKKKYWLRYIEFHHPSEHHIDSQPHSVEMQIYHKSDDEQWLVASYFLEIDSKNINTDNDNFKKIIEFIKSKNTESTISLSKILSKNNLSFFYEGSFTQPPCTEGVKWYIFKEPQYLSRDQLNQIINLTIFSKPNNRKIQKFNPDKF